MQEYLEKLKSAGLRKTEQRLSLLEVLLKNKKPLSADDIHLQAKKRVSMDLATVYRILGQFEKSQIVEKPLISKNTACYRLISRHKHSHHIECKVCHSISEIEACLVEKQTRALKKKGFTEITHRLEFFAVCPQCVK